MYHGSCLCGSIQYEVDSDLKAVVNCHCRFCRKAHGAPFTTVLFMPLSSLRVTAGAELIVRYPIARLNSERCFCAKCGSRLFNQALAVGMMSLVVASLEGDLPLRPVAHINVESKCSWFHINDDLPQFASVPPPPELGQLLGGTPSGAAR
jgi:hypothetical protein